MWAPRGQVGALAQNRWINRGHTRTAALPGNNTSPLPDSSSSLYRLPLFPSRQVLLPGETGTLTVHDRAAQDMFRTLRLSNQLERGSGLRGPRVGCVLSPDLAPPALLEQSSISGVPKVGVLAEILEMQEQGDGSLSVKVQAGRRYQTLAMVSTTPPLEACVMTLGDDLSLLTPSDRKLVDTMELHLYEQLKEVVKYTALLSKSGPSPSPSQRLPENIIRYAPSLTSGRSLAEALSQGGFSAVGHSIATWQRQGSVYKNSGGSLSQRMRRGGGDPYKAALEAAIQHDVRQELFSYAAAAMVDMGMPERLALLNSREILSRIGWLIKVVSQHVLELRARAAVMQVVGKNASDN